MRLVYIIRSLLRLHFDTNDRLGEGAQCLLLCHHYIPLLLGSATSGLREIVLGAVALH